MAKVKIDKNTCIDCGVCVSLVPEVFEFGDDNRVYVKKSEVTGKLLKKVKEAKENCPTGSIEIEE